MEFEMAQADKPEEIVKATQKALLRSMRNVISELRSMRPGLPGLLWEEIEFFIDQFENKTPKIVHQESPI